MIFEVYRILYNNGNIMSHFEVKSIVGIFTYKKIERKLLWNEYSLQEYN